METPAGMIEVTEKQFFAALFADQRDVMPSHNQPDHTDWLDKNARVFGRTFPGWKNPGDEKHYLLNG